MLASGWCSKTFADRLCIYHDQKLIATHTRSYDRYRDFENPDHVKDLLDQRRQARNAKLLLSFYALCPHAQEYYRQLQDRRLNPRIHVAKIMALSEVYGPDKVARALEDAFEFRAFSSDYIANILEQRERLTVQPGPLHLTRRSKPLSPSDGIGQKRLISSRFRIFSGCASLTKKPMLSSWVYAGSEKPTWLPLWDMPLVSTATASCLPTPLTQSIH
jgi:hypothetical protein